MLCLFRTIGAVVMALGLGILLSCILPAWMLVILLGAVVIGVGLLLLKRW